MDTIFILDEGPRAAFLQHIMQSLGCTYICLWQYLPQPSHCLLFLDGIYQEGNNQASSSSGSLAQRLFNEYRQLVFDVDDGRVPGLAFKNNLPYIELKESDLQTLSSKELQLRFYREARIKTVIFMGCKTGEIELGTSNDNQIDLEMEMKNWFPEDFSQQALPRELITQPTDQNRPSSSSSSLRSPSMDSPEYSTLLFNVPGTSYVPEPHTDSPVEQALRPTSTTINPLQRAMQTLNQIRNIQFPTIESEDAAMTRAILAVLSSPSSSSSSHQPPHQSLPPNYQLHQKASAFRTYRSALAPTTQITARVRRQNILKRAITYLRSVNLTRTQEQVQGSRPITSSQLHHMISERRRREKLNESFQALRSILPTGSKKDKASVLTSTTEYLNSLKAQVAELSRRNQILEAQLPRKEAVEEGSETSNERLNVMVTHIAESTSEARIVDLQVNARGECSMLDLVIRILEFLKQVKNISILSVEADVQMVESRTITRVRLRLKIEGAEWDESAFQEAVRRVVDDLAH